MHDEEAKFRFVPGWEIPILQWRPLKIIILMIVIMIMRMIMRMKMRMRKITQFYSALSARFKSAAYNSETKRN